MADPDTTRPACNGTGMTIKHKVSRTMTSTAQNGALTNLAAFDAAIVRLESRRRRADKNWLETRLSEFGEEKHLVAQQLQWARSRRSDMMVAGAWPPETSPKSCAHTRHDEILTGRNRNEKKNNRV